MSTAATTCWTLIRAAAAGSRPERDEFARRYGRVVRTYLAARWRTSPLLRDLDDAVQDVFVECFRPQGLLARADADRPGGFRAFLYGAVRHVALRRETRRPPAPANVPLNEIPADDPSQSQVFDRAWAKTIFRAAARLQEERANDAAKKRRVALLRLRFQENKPIRDIAKRWNVEAASLHREYAKARQEFRAALEEVVAFHHPGSPEEVAQACANLLSLLA